MMYVKSISRCLRRTLPVLMAVTLFATGLLAGGAVCSCCAAGHVADAGPAAKTCRCEVPEPAPEPVLCCSSESPSGVRPPGSAPVETQSQGCACDGSMATAPLAVAATIGVCSLDFPALSAAFLSAACLGRLPVCTPALAQTSGASPPCSFWLEHCVLLS